MRYGGTTDETTTKGTTMTMFNPEIEAAYDEQDAYYAWCRAMDLDPVEDHWDAYDAAARDL